MPRYSIAGAARQDQSQYHGFSNWNAGTTSEVSSGFQRQPTNPLANIDRQSSTQSYFRQSKPQKNIKDIRKQLKKKKSQKNVANLEIEGESLLEPPSAKIFDKIRRSFNVVKSVFTG